ncbi:RIP metalloprotease RseP [Stagnihabitans tardus]|uniref:Zinc metalloprotease n=1 Tax=Stagnihabitans tardus TaxID=2699202 RepID=A0AAE5BSI6_9RHOB|nr:RIP metalloprotease RseP [Stagnihabitans tardus]NBZ87890.1 RIP metalloprotease RseP [Stagnihabitans tardus]
MEVIGVLWFLVALVVIVTVHEYGHYIVGRWSGIKAEVFSIGFGQVIYSRTDRHGTRWQIAAIPLGGYVKFKGDSDASSRPTAGGLEGLSAAERRQTMQGAPLWARSATVLAGPFANFLLAVAILVGLIFWQGLPVNEVRVGSVAPMAQGVLQEGDLIQAIDGQETPDFTAFYTVADGLSTKPRVAYQIERAGAEVTVEGPNPLPPLVGQVMLKSAALEADLRPGDLIVKAGGQDIASFGQLPDIVKAGDGAPVTLTVQRDGESFDLTLTPRRSDLPKAEGGFETRWLIGLNAGSLFEPATRTPGVLEATGLAVEQGFGLLKVNVEGVVAMLAGKISVCRNLSSPVGMAQAVAQAAEQGAAAYLSLLAVFSLGIGLMNLFPIPVLDGGHLVFHLYEAVTRRPPSDRAMQVLMMAGIAVLVSIMLYAVLSDLVGCL